jgi:hypothetical protein
MRRLTSIAMLLALALTLGTVAANAQTQVTLGPSANGSISFVGSGGNVSINLGTGGVLNGLSALLPAGPDYYTMTQSGSISLASNGNITQASPISFYYNNGSGGTLTGNLQLVNFLQAGSLGLFNDALLANLTGLGGTLAPSFLSVGSAGIADITIVVQNGQSVNNLFSSNGTVLAHVSSGEIVPTPESSSVVLFGAGLLAIGLLWRRFGRLQPQQVSVL